MQERDFFTETEELHGARLSCPFCRAADDYELHWITRRKKPALPPRASEEERLKFTRARSYMVRKDDVVLCKNTRCRKRFEISSVQSVVLL